MVGTLRPIKGLEIRLWKVRSVKKSTPSVAMSATANAVFITNLGIFLDMKDFSFEGIIDGVDVWKPETIDVDSKDDKDGKENKGFFFSSIKKSGILRDKGILFKRISKCFTTRFL